MGCVFGSVLMGRETTVTLLNCCPPALQLTVPPGIEIEVNVQVCSLISCYATPRVELSVIAIDSFKQNGMVPTIWKKALHSPGFGKFNGTIS